MESQQFSGEEETNRCELFQHNNDVEAEKQWIENSRYLTNINSLEAQRHWINNTITEQVFAEKLLSLSRDDDTIRINNFSLFGVNSNEITESSQVLNNQALLSNTLDRSVKSSNLDQTKFNFAGGKSVRANVVLKSKGDTSNEIKTIFKSKKSDEFKYETPRRITGQLSDKCVPAIQDNHCNYTTKSEAEATKQGSSNNENLIHHRTANRSESVDRKKEKPLVNHVDVRPHSAGSVRNLVKIVHKPNSKKMETSKEVVQDVVTEESDSLMKMHHNYDKGEMRKFIKQRQKERFEKVLQENKVKENERKDKEKQLEHLKETQKKIIQHSKMRAQVRSPEKPQWVGPMERNEVKTKTKGLAYSPPKFSDPKSKTFVPSKLVLKKSCRSSSTPSTKPKTAGGSFTESVAFPNKLTDSIKSKLPSKPSTAATGTTSSSRVKNKENRPNISSDAESSNTAALENACAQPETPSTSLTNVSEKCYANKFSSNENFESLVKPKSNLRFNLPSKQNISETSLSGDVKHFREPIFSSDINFEIPENLTNSYVHRFLPSSYSEPLDKSRIEESAYVYEEDVEFLNSRVTRKRRSSRENDVQTEDDESTTNKIQKLPTAVETIIEKLKSAYQPNTLSNCSPSMDWMRKLEVPVVSFKPFPSLSGLFHRSHFGEARSHDETTEISSSRNYYDNEMTSKSDLKLDIPSSASTYRSEVADSFDFIADQSTPDGKLFRRALENLVSEDPPITLKSSAKESLFQMYSPADTNDLVLGDLSKVNTRRPSTSLTQSSASVQLNVDPLILSPSIENLSFEYVSQKDLNSTKLIKEDKPREIECTVEDKFLLACTAADNGNISSIIETLPKIQNEDKLEQPQIDPEKMFEARCASLTNDIPSIDLLKKSPPVNEAPTLDNASLTVTLSHLKNVAHHRDSKSDAEIKECLNLKPLAPQQCSAFLTRDDDAPKSDRYRPDISLVLTSNVKLTDSCFSSQRNSGSMCSVKEILVPSDNLVKSRVIKEKPTYESNLSDQSSSYSEVVKVSRTVSRGGSTLVSEISELHTLSSGSVQYNSSSLHKRIRNEIKHLDRLEANLSSVLDTTRITSDVENINANQFLNKEDKLHCSLDVQNVNSSNQFSTIEQRTNDNNSKELTEHRGEISGLTDISNISGFNISTFSLEMLDDLLKDEDLKYEHHIAVIKMQEKALIDRAKAEIAYLEMQKRQFKEMGREEEARNIKKKQRGVVVRVDEEVQQIEKIRKAEKVASRERKLLIQQQQQLLKLQMGSKYHSMKRSPANKVQRIGHSKISSNVIDSVTNVNYERGANLSPYLEKKTKELLEKENALLARKKNIESIVAWKRRLDEEERKVQEMEKLIAFSPSVIPSSAVAIDRGTSPMRFTVDNKDLGSDASNSTVHEAVPIHNSVASQSESETQNKEYNSDSFEQSSVVSDQLLSNVTIRNSQSSILESKRKKSLAALRCPLSPRVTILKRRHSSGSDDSMLFSQNETLSDQSDMEVRVSALQQQLKMRKAELEKLRKEFNKGQRERLRAKEQSLINQIQAYDSYIDQVKNELQNETDKNEIKVMKPLIKQPKFCDRRKSEIIPTVQEKKKDESTVSDSSSIVQDQSSTSSKKGSSIEEPFTVADTGDHDSSETQDSVKTQLESKVFDSPDVSFAKEHDNFAPTRSADGLSLVEVFSDRNSVATTLATNEEVVIEDLELHSEVSGISEEITPGTPVSDVVSIVPSIESEFTDAVSVEPEETKNISEKLDSIVMIGENNSKSSVKSIPGELNENTLTLSQVKTSDNVMVVESYSVPLSSEESVEQDQKYEETSASEGSALRVSSHQTVSQFNMSGVEVLSNIDEISNVSTAAHEKSQVSEMVSEIKEQLETISKLLNESENLSPLDSVEEDASSSLQSQSYSVDSLKSLKSKNIPPENATVPITEDYDPEQVVEDERLNSVDENSEVRSVTKSQVSINEESSLDLSNLAQLNLKICFPNQLVSAEDDNIDTASKIEIEEVFDKEETVVSSEEPFLINEPINSENCKIIIEHCESGDENIGELDFSIASSQGTNDDFKIVINNESSPNTGNKTKVIDLMDNSFEISDKLWKEDTFKHEETPLLRALQMERQKNMNFDSVWREICDTCIEEATDAVTTAFIKKRNALALLNGIYKDGNAAVTVIDHGNDGNGVLVKATEKMIDDQFTENVKITSLWGDFPKESRRNVLVYAAKVGDNEEFWLGEGLTLQTAREAEQLRLQQLQIEQEIEELEQAQEAVPYYYVREIPNKPPPPYTPPGRVAPTAEENLARVTEAASMLWEIELAGGDICAQNVPPAQYLSSGNDQPHPLFLFELAKELYIKLRPPPGLQTPAWVLAQRSLRPLPKISTKEDFLKQIEHQAKLAFNYEPRMQRENMIMKWSRKKRDQVDEILIRECQDEEQEWIDFSVEENMIKNQIADSVIDQVFRDAVNGLAVAFKNKFSKNS